MIGRIGPSPDGLDEPYWSGLADGRLCLQRCSRCHTWIWAPQWCCPECLELEPGWAQVEPRGRVFTWTRTVQAFTPEMADRVPFVTVIVELPGADGRRLAGLYASDGDPVIGEEVAGVFASEGDVAVLRWARV